MKWQFFNSNDVPQNKVFLLSIEDDVFFAKVTGKRIVTRYTYADAVECVSARGGYLECFINNLCRRGVTAKWAAFELPGV